MPAHFQVEWGDPRPGNWSVALRYRYSDDYHIEHTDRLLREDPFAGAVFEIGGRGLAND